MIRVLIVEDQAILRESLARSVGDQPDMTIVSAIADASEALGVALRERPDMILMDVCTEHDSNGIVAAARIKEQLPECRIIIMTGMPEITFVDQAREAGVDSFVYKNVGIDELFAVMRSTLAGYCTFPKPPESIFSGTAALDDVELSILRLACEGKSANEPGGARSLRRRLQTEIEGPAAELLLRDPSVRTLRAVWRQARVVVEAPERCF